MKRLLLILSLVAVCLVAVPLTASATNFGTLGVAVCNQPVAFSVAPVYQQLQFAAQPVVQFNTQPIVTYQETIRVPVNAQAYTGQQRFVERIETPIVQSHIAYAPLAFSSDYSQNFQVAAFTNQRQVQRFSSGHQQNQVLLLQQNNHHQQAVRLKVVQSPPPVRVKVVQPRQGIFRR